MTWRFSSARKHPLVNLFRITISLRKMSQIFLTFYIFYFSLLINSIFSISFRFSKINDSCITRHIHYLIDVIRGGGGKGRRGGRKGGGLVILVLFIVFVFFVSWFTYTWWDCRQGIRPELEKLVWRIILIIYWGSRCLDGKKNISIRNPRGGRTGIIDVRNWVLKKETEWEDLCSARVGFIKNIHQVCYSQSIWFKLVQAVWESDMVALS